MVHVRLGLLTAPDKIKKKEINKSVGPIILKTNAMHCCDLETQLIFVFLILIELKQQKAFSVECL
jgi:hypothetical protein